MNTKSSKEEIRDKHEALNRFLVDNAELEKLTAQLSRFNIFQILRIEKAEIRHSCILAWLLRPHESHGLGDSFVRRFLSTILLDNPGIVNITPAQIELMNMNDVEVWRELKNIDVLAVSKNNKWILIIENKIRAGVNELQLRKYIESIKLDYPKFKTIPVLLTLEIGDASEIAESEGYINWSHVDLYNVVNSLISQRKDQITEDAQIFLHHYLTILGRMTMQDKNLVELCKTIYKKHKDAIDLINEYGITTEFSSAAEEFLKNKENIYSLCTRPKQEWFILKSWRIKNIKLNGWKHLNEPVPICCRFSFNTERSRCGFIIEIGPIENMDKRSKLLRIFNKSGFDKVKEKLLKSNSSYTRVYSQYKRIEDANDKDEFVKHFEELWKTAEPFINKTTKIIKSFEWDK
ncbi:hypothetical protein ASZ90_006412 [hydrocarbon metagenome]|uniref:PD-(D/E)XK nuclease superfamily protein n=1 Tax=hydrocarbon metagenome TaxID=938273 RepID=A0A0W8FSE7_9ZZZZ